MNWRYEFWNKQTRTHLYNVHRESRIDGLNLLSHQNVVQLQLTGDTVIQVKEFLDDEQISMGEYTHEDYIRMRNNRIKMTMNLFNVKMIDLKTKKSKK
jgi:hypothetical protein